MAATATKVTVFEWVNLARREIFVSASSLSTAEVIARLSADPPFELRHWKAGEPVEHRNLEQGMDAASAAAFIEKYAATQEGWRVILPMLRP